MNTKAELQAEVKTLEDALLQWMSNFNLIRGPDDHAITSPNPRWKSIALTHFEEGFMALRRSLDVV